MSLSRTEVRTEEAHQRIQQYAEFVGISIEGAASNAVSEWMTGTGYPVMDAIEKRRKANAERPKLTLVKGAKVA